MSLLDKFLNNIKIEKRIETGQKIRLDIAKFPEINWN